MGGLGDRDMGRDALVLGFVGVGGGVAFVGFERFGIVWVCGCVGVWSGSLLRQCSFGIGAAVG